MFKSNDYALSLIIILISLGFAYSLRCWDCNSLINDGCSDPFKSDDFDLADCNQKFTARYPNQPGSICRKIIQKVNDDYRTIRGCGYVNEEGNEIKANTQISNDCIKRAGTFSVLVQYCSCNSDDGCNHSNHLIVSSLTLIIPFFLMIAKLL